jgi:hypothetical protein
MKKLYGPGYLVTYTLDIEPRIYRVKSWTFKNGDWWYRFHRTGQGFDGNWSDPELPQGSLIRVNSRGQIWGTP